MKTLRRGATVFMLVMTSLCAAAAPPTTRSTTRPSTLPTQDEIRALLDQKKYSTVVPAVNAALGVKGAKASQYDRYELLMIKGEAYLALSQFKSAREAFSSAADTTDDAVKSATARATRQLVIEVKGPPEEQRLVPDPPLLAANTKRRQARLRDPALLEREHRAESLKSLLGEIRTLAETRVKVARPAKTIPPLIDALEALALKYDFELATGGSGDADKATFEEMAAIARTRMGKELDRMKTQATQILENASEVVGTTDDYRNARATINDVSVPAREGRTISTPRPIYRGASRDEQLQLSQMVQTCNRIVSTVAMLDRGAGADRPADEQLVADAKDVVRIANDSLRYQRTTR